ncbi:MAG: molybdenum ABC transporter ATP-binding protein, partial [Clostridiales bacterium]|nr:molybdenum ABC transporter ATP-binding protein [Clostridiales bacterium]
FARDIATYPRILVLDEPFASIDAKVRKELSLWLKNMIHQVGITSIFVTHDQDEAVEVADEILVINEGRLEQIGDPVDIYKNPKTSFVAQFIGTSTVLENFTGMKGFEKVAKSSHAVVRPEFVEAFKSDNEKFAKLIPDAESGVITEIAFRGNMLELTLDVNGVSLKTNRSLERRPVQIGEQMCVLIYRVYIIDGEDTRIYENQRLADVDVETL